MTDDELERMRAYAEAAREHPTWSVAYAQDVPRLLAALDELRGLLTTLGWKNMGTYWERVHTGGTSERMWHRLRFAEMVLDRLNAEVDGIPWRQAARLNEALDGEPATEPVAKSPGTGVQSTD